MTQLFGSKWSSQRGPIKALDEKGQINPRAKKYSDEFLLWCRKLESLTDQEYQRGFLQVEFLVGEAGKNSETIWPPSYAEFLAYCKKPWGEQAHRLLPVTPDENGFCDPKAPRAALPDLAAQERAKTTGRNELDRMRNLFN